MPSGRKTIREEAAILQRWADLQEPVFKFLIQCLNGDDKTDKKWATEQAVKGLVKMIPQQIASDPDNPLSLQITIDSSTALKYGITPSTTPNSGGFTQVSDTSVREEVRQDDTGGGRDNGMRNIQAQQENTLPSPDTGRFTPPDVGQTK